MDSIQLGNEAEAVLGNEAFRKVCEDIQDGLKKAFLGEDNDKAMEARAEARAIEGILTRLTRMQQRGAHIRKRQLEEAEKKEQ